MSHYTTCDLCVNGLSPASTDIVVTTQFLPAYFFYLEHHHLSVVNQIAVFSQTLLFGPAVGTGSYTEEAGLPRSGLYPGIKCLVGGFTSSLGSLRPCKR
jgi:hypothetical protein